MNFLHFSSDMLSIRCSSLITYYPPLEEIPIKTRLNFSFFKIEYGELIYRFNNTSVHFNEGDIIFLPAVCIPYSYEAIKEGTYIKQIFFDFSLDGVKIPFNHPTKIIGKTATDIENAIASIIGRFPASEPIDSIEAAFVILGCMRQLLYKDTSDKPRSQVFPAILHINENPDTNISVKELTALCGLSESHFRRLFILETGISPLKYKNKIRANRACDYLTNHMLPVSRVAEIMNFDTPYSFSKFFKNEMGISPLKYVKNKLFL